MHTVESELTSTIREILTLIQKVRMCEQQETDTFTSSWMRLYLRYNKDYEPSTNGNFWNRATRSMGKEKYLFTSVRLNLDCLPTFGRRGRKRVPTLLNRTVR